MWAHGGEISSSWPGHLKHNMHLGVNREKKQSQHALVMRFKYHIRSIDEINRTSRFFLRNMTAYDEHSIRL